MNYLVDYHTHSLNSLDGNNSIKELCESAVKMGIREIAVTDHFEPSEKDPMASFYNPKAYWAEVLKAKERYRERLKVRMGVELGQPHQFKESSESLLETFPYDYVLGSVHSMTGGLTVDKLASGNLSSEKLCAVYLEELKKLAEWGKFDCVGHLDLVKRYGAAFYKDRISLMSQYDMLKDVLKTVIEKGKGIEINTSGLRQGPKETMPGIDVLRLYRELGGEILTIGSDSHYAEDIGKGVADALELAAEAGFKHITVFKKRMPKWKRIVDKSSIYAVTNELNIS